MSDHLTHECGLALVRLRQPLSYYREQYGDPGWGLRQLYLLMEKQHNRGQDGAGVAIVKFDMPPGDEFLARFRSDRHNAIERVFDVVMRDLKGLSAAGSRPSARESAAESRRTLAESDVKLKQACEFLGEVMLGHLRYATYATHSRANCHPYVRRNNAASRNLAIAGNFNMTNSAELFQKLIEYGLNPVGESDTQVILEKIGYALDREHEHLMATMGPESFRHLQGRELAEEVSRELDLVRILRKASQDWDGGYVFAGLLGNGDCFAVRDPSGIRPGYFFINDEVAAVASERAALANVFNVDPERVEPIRPGHILAVKRGGEIRHEPFTEARELRQDVFERIYFSRGNDPDIYHERKALGRNLAPRVLASLEAAETPPGSDALQHAVFSFIPNTAEAAYMGLLEEIERVIGCRREAELWRKIESGSIQRGDLAGLLNGRIRAEKVAHKDQRLRTFITHDAARRDLVLHIYDITRGVVKPTDTLVVLDDSIVRGTTLRESIITILSRLQPRRIIVASSAPPIMYPDCYGIDISQLGRFVAFEAAVALLRERGEETLLDEVEEACAAQAHLPPARMVNHVGRIYERFTLAEISDKVAQLVRPPTATAGGWGGKVEVIYQDIAGLHEACPNHSGDWYFTGRYPTPGGYRVLNTSYINWRRQADVRAY
jgi:amidophosphoribosyltransferase